MSRTNIILGSILAIAIIAWALLFLQGPRSSGQEIVRVADQGAIGGALFHIALENGYFEEEGLNISVVKVQTGDEALKALAGGSVDVALGGLIPYSFLALNTQEFKVFAVNAYVHDNRIIADRTKGVTIPTDLRRKRIAYTKTTASHIGIEQFLATHGIAEDEVTLIDMKPLAMAGALASGQIDAYSSWEPYVLNGEKLLGNKAIVFSGPSDIYTWHQILVSDERYIQSHQDTLKKFVAAFKKAQQFEQGHPKEAIELSAKHNNLSVDVLEKIWPMYDLVITINGDVPKILATDLAWANGERSVKTDSIPAPSVLIYESIIGDAK